MAAANTRAISILLCPSIRYPTAIKSAEKPGKQDGCPRVVRRNPPSVFIRSLAQTGFGDNLGNGSLVAWRHNVSSADASDLRKLVQQIDADPLSLRDGVAGSRQPIDERVWNDRAR
jgi:hypothetical protein